MIPVPDTTLAEERRKLFFRIMRCVRESPLDTINRLQIVNITASYLLGEEVDWEGDVLYKFIQEMSVTNAAVCMVAAESIKEYLEKERDE